MNNDKPTPTTIGRPEKPTMDHLGRTDKDFAIEFGRYLADSAERFMEASHSREPVDDEWGALKSAIYEFRKRADRAMS